MDNTRIIEVARLVLAVDKAPDDEVLEKRLKDGLEALKGYADGALLHMATKLLGGQPWRISTDNPETARRCRSIAADLGATISAAETEGGQTVLRFNPPSIQ